MFVVTLVTTMGSKSKLVCSAWALTPLSANRVRAVVRCFINVSISTVVSVGRPRLSTATDMVFNPADSTFSDLRQSVYPFISR